MTYSIEDIKRLVPEATRVEESEVISGAIEFSINGYIGHTAYGPGPALLTTRRQLEIAIECLKKPEGTSHGLLTLKQTREALDAIKQAGDEK